jgi:hypothetical protein
VILPSRSSPFQYLPAKKKKWSNKNEWSVLKKKCGEQPKNKLKNTPEAL